MTVFQDSLGNPSHDRAASELRDALRLLSAVSDLACGQPRRFSLTVASLAAHLAEPFGLGRDDAAACYFAGLMHGIGAVRVILDPEFEEITERTRMIASWDAPVYGAAMCRAIAALPPAAADYVRWHREAFDGTGFPDQLRWNGIPQGAVVVGIARAFRALCTGAQDRAPEEAVYELMQGAGRAFSAATMRRFYDVIRTRREIFENEFDVPLDGLYASRTSSDEVIALIATAVDERSAETRQRSMRIAELSRAVGTRLGLDAAALDELGRCARLIVLGSLQSDGPSDNIDPLSRIARERRAREAAAAAQLVTSGRTYADLAPILRASFEWFDGTGLPDRLGGSQIPLAARILAVCIVSESLEAALPGAVVSAHTPPAERISAAAGNQFDPRVVEAYVAVKSA